MQKTGSQTVVLIQSSFRAPDADHIRSYFETAWKALETVSGYEGAGVWTEASDPSKGLILQFYRNSKAAEDGLKVISRASLLAQSQSIPQDTPNVLRFHVVDSFGDLKEKPTSASYLSLSIRVADPGRGCELQDDLHTVFAESVALDGFCGQMIGVNDTLEEEVIGLASWKSPEAYALSLPAGILYTVRLFKKLL